MMACIKHLRTTFSFYHNIHRFHEENKNALVQALLPVLSKLLVKNAAMLISMEVWFI
jgi:hypothetical protein